MSYISKCSLSDLESKKDCFFFYSSNEYSASNATKYGKPVAQPAQIRTGGLTSNIFVCPSGYQYDKATISRTSSGASAKNGGGGDAGVAANGDAQKWAKRDPTTQL